MYKTLVRPVVDYMACVYHPMLTLDQSNELERLQMHTLKIIYGPKISYRTALEQSGQISFRERRQECFDNFAIKLANNPEYEQWLPRTTFTGYDLREELIYEE